MNQEKKTVNFMVCDVDSRKLDAICLRLDLSKSEVARRALRLGLAKLQRVTLPGSAPEEAR